MARMLGSKERTQRDKIRKLMRANHPGLRHMM